MDINATNFHYSFLEPAFTPGVLRGTCPELPIALFFNADGGRIERSLAFCANQIDEQFTEAKLAPLHLAAMRCNKHAIDLLVKRGANIHTRDFQGYTPLHHAAIGCGFAEVDHLLSLGASPNAKENHGGTYADLLRFNIDTRKSPKLQEHARYFSAHQADWVDVAPKCVGKQREFTDEIVATRKNLVSEWSKTPLAAQTPDEFHSLARESYKKFKHLPPQLEVRPPHGAPSRFCGLFAGQDIEPGEVIGEYVGELLQPSEENSRDPEYMWSDLPPIDAGHFMSAAAFANDATPNAMVYHFSNQEKGLGVDGILRRKLFIALEKIKEGDEITINYGPGHSVKSASHGELRQKGLDEYLANHSWKTIADKAFAALYVGTLPADEVLEGKNHLIKLEYLLSTPSTMVDLVKRRKITLEDLNMLSSKFPRSMRSQSMQQAYQEIKKLHSL